MEDRVEYIVAGKSRTVTPARVLELLIKARDVMQIKLERHRRKQAKAKQARDAEFHGVVVDDCRRLVEDANIAIEAIQTELLKQ